MLDFFLYFHDEDLFFCYSVVFARFLFAMSNAISYLCIINGD